MNRRERLALAAQEIEDRLADPGGLEVWVGRLTRVFDDVVRDGCYAPGDTGVPRAQGQALEVTSCVMKL